MTKKGPDLSALRERCLQHFAVLRIPITAQQLDSVLDEAEREAWPPLVDHLRRSTSPPRSPPVPRAQMPAACS